MYFSTSDCADPGARFEPANGFVRVTQGLSAVATAQWDGTCSGRSGLRPDPASTQVAISTESAMHYYDGKGAPGAAPR